MPFSAQIGASYIVFRIKLQISDTACPEIVQKQQQLRVAGTKQAEGVPLA